jgi:hypothetical protein
MAPVAQAVDDAVLVRYRNRDIREGDLSFIRSVLADRPGRVEAFARICEAWGWRQANGAPAVLACADLLLRLQEWGYIQLPPPRCPGRRARTERGRAGNGGLMLPMDLIPLTGLDVRDPVDLSRLIVRPIAPEERLGCRLYMARYHYLGDRTIIGEHILYAAFLDGELVALLAWASAAFRVPLRETFIGWDEPTKRRRLHLVVNNVRFLVLPWVRVRNLASKILALNLQRLSADWDAVWRHPLYLAETFVDASRFRGTCYRAANWIHLGQTAGRTKRGNAYLFGASPKSIYVYPLHRRALPWLRGEGGCPA